MIGQVEQTNTNLRGSLNPMSIKKGVHGKKASQGSEGSHELLTKLRQEAETGTAYGGENQTTR